MKKIYYLLLLSLFYSKSFSQTGPDCCFCVSLGCAISHTVITNGALPDTLISTGFACYNGNSCKQVYWQYFYSPSTGSFTQTYTPTSGTNLAINYEIFDVGTIPPFSIGCPVNTAGWASVACGVSDHFNMPVGPGLFGVTLTTTGGHYYAIAIIIWQGVGNGGSASYTFNISDPQLDGIDLKPANCPGVLFNPTIYSSRWRKDDGSETTATWIAADDTQATVTSNSEVLRLRLFFKNFLDSSIDVFDTLQYATSPDGPWINIDLSAGSNPFEIAGTSAFVTQAEPTTEQLNYSFPNASFFTPGKIMVDSTVLKNFSLEVTQETEFEWAIRCNTNIKPNTTYYFRQWGSLASLYEGFLPSLVTLASLPLKLTSFFVRHEGKIIKLNWVTASEQNSDRFEIQRSSDGIHFTQIGVVKSGRNSSVARSYHFDDASPVKGINYYRLRIVDVDNSAIYSEVKSIKNISSLNFTIYPNPVKNLLKINIEAEKTDDVQIIINNIIGQTLYSRKIKIEHGFNSISIDVNNFSKGTYIVKAQSGNENYIKKFNKE